MHFLEWKYANLAYKISLKFVPKVRINNIPAFVQIMAWRRPGDKPLSEPMMVSLLMHIWVTRPQWANGSCLPSSQHRDYYPGTLSLTHLPLDKMAAILADDFFKCIFLNENDKIPIQISLKLVPRSPINNKPALVQVMAWCRTGDKP